jgi:hypothetical protein
VADLEAEGRQVGADTVDYIHAQDGRAHPPRCGWARCSAGRAAVRALSVAGADLGSPLQIVDDIPRRGRELGRAGQDRGQDRSSRRQPIRPSTASRPPAPVRTRWSCPRRGALLAPEPRARPAPRLRHVSCRTGGVHVEIAPTPARCSTPAAIPPSRSKSGSSRARSGAPWCPRAPRRASARPSSCATTTTTATAARACAVRCRTSTR